MNTDFKLRFCGVVLFVFLAVCCYLWYQWETEPYRQDSAKTQQLLHEWTLPDVQHDTPKLPDGDNTVVAPVEQKSTDKTDTPIEDVKPHK